MLELDEHTITTAIEKASPSEKLTLLKLLNELESRKKRTLAQNKFMEFVTQLWPDFILGAHHRHMAHLFEDIVNGKKKRVIINMPPRHTKSKFASFLLPSWFLGKYPEKKIMQVSNTAELAEGFGRDVRNLLASDEYRRIFPEVELRQDSKAAGRWSTNFGGEYYATGVGGALAGRGAHLCIIDDPHAESEALAAQFNPAIYDKVYEWYTTGPRQRLQPGGSLVVVMCMTGDTKVLLANGSEIDLKRLQVGDSVATYDHGNVTTAKVLNWQLSGVDSVYKIQTQSGNILRANKRHPFLVDVDGVKQWIPLQHIKPGMALVSLKAAPHYRAQSVEGTAQRATKNQSTKSLILCSRMAHVLLMDAVGRLGQKINPECAQLVLLWLDTTKKIQQHFIEVLGITENGKGLNVLKQVATILFRLRGCALNTRLENEQLPGFISKHLSKIVPDASSIGMGLPLKIIWCWLKHRMESARCVVRHRGITLEHIGVVSYVLTIATKRIAFVHCCVTTAILPWATQKRKKQPWLSPHTSVFMTDKVLKISYDGEEDVFDVEIDRTENFIANGVVSHNTRWHMRDLTGQIIDASLSKDGVDQWEVIEFPAILPSGKPTWPEYWSIAELEAIRAELPNLKWQAQYQQQPTSEQAAIIKREWWQMWESSAPPAVEFVIMTMDTAFEAKQSADYSAAIVLGIWLNPEDNDQPNVIVLNAWRDKLEFPELKEKTLELYREWEPDAFVIEKKASGAPLIAEIRRMGVPVQDYTPVRGSANSPNNKLARLNAVADIFASGKVWAPASERWASALIDEVASFPSGKNDDWVDCMSLGLSRYRQGGFVGTALDDAVNDNYDYSYRRKAAYY